jgi:hypothetical protein
MRSIGGGVRRVDGFVGEIHGAIYGQYRTKKGKTKVMNGPSMGPLRGIECGRGRAEYYAPPWISPS